VSDAGLPAVDTAAAELFWSENAMPPPAPTTSELADEFLAAGDRLPAGGAPEVLDPRPGPPRAGMDGRRRDCF
jgi:hypothetical protein